MATVVDTVGTAALCTVVSGCACPSDWHNADMHLHRSAFGPILINRVLLSAISPLLERVEHRHGLKHMCKRICQSASNRFWGLQSAKAGVSLSISIDYFTPQPGMEEVNISAQVGKTRGGMVVQPCSCVR